MVAASKLITSFLSGKVFSAIFHEFSPSIVKTLSNYDANASALSQSVSQCTFLSVFGLYNCGMFTLIFLLLLTCFQKILELFLTSS